MSESDEGCLGFVLMCFAIIMCFVSIFMMVRTSGKPSAAEQRLLTLESRIAALEAAQEQK